MIFSGLKLQRYEEESFPTEKKYSLQITLPSICAQAEETIFLSLLFDPC